MNTERQISGLCRLGTFLKDFLNKNAENYNRDEAELLQTMRLSEQENPWFTQENQRYALQNWANLLNEESITNWLNNYRIAKNPKKVGLILAGNIPLVGFHDVICVVLSGHIPMIKLSSKDRRMIPFLLKMWQEFSGNQLEFEFVERLENFDAVIATGSNNTARYLEYYFKNHLSIIRKNRTSIAVLNGQESDEDLQHLADDIFTYFGLGCRNVTKILIPEGFKIDRLFENFQAYKDIINHHKYANNYDYNRAIYLLNLDLFWDNNFVMLREDEELFHPLSVIGFSRYKDISEVQHFIKTHNEDIQAIVAKVDFIEGAIPFGEAQNPSLDTYADLVDTMKFLEVI